MNWTGGRFQRHSGKGNSALVSRQKTYFARARTKLQNGPGESSPFKPSFFQQEDDYDKNASIESHSSQSAARKRQTILDEYETVAPLVSRLNALRSRKPLPHLRPSDSAGISHRRYNSGKPSKSGQQSSSPSAAQQKGSEGVHVYHLQTGQSHAKDTFPQLHRTRPHRSYSSLQGLVLEDKRRELLVQRDWVGLAPSRPLHMDFASDSDKDQIGKRRKITDRDRLRQDAATERIRVPSVREEYFMRGALRNDCSDGGLKIKIRIGDDALVSQMSTRRSNHRPSSIPSQIESSESMLFDREDDLQHMPGEHFGSELMLSERESYVQEYPKENFAISDAMVAHDCQSWQVSDVIEHDVEFIDARKSNFYLHDRNPKGCGEKERMLQEENEFREVLHDSVITGTRASIASAPRIPKDLLGDRTFRLMFPTSPSSQSLSNDSRSCQMAGGSGLTQEKGFPSEDVYEEASDHRAKIDDDRLRQEFMQVPDAEPSQVREPLGLSHAPAHRPYLEPQDEICVAENAEFESSPEVRLSPRKPFPLGLGPVSIYSQLRSPPESLKMIDALAKMPAARPAPVQDADELWRSFVFGDSSSQRSGTFPKYRAGGDHGLGTSVAAHASGSSGSVPVASLETGLINVSGRIHDEHPRSTTAQNTFASSLISSPQLPAPSTTTQSLNSETCASFSEDSLAFNRAARNVSQDYEGSEPSSDYRAKLSSTTQLSLDKASVRPGILSTKRWELTSSSPAPLMKPFNEGSKRSSDNWANPSSKTSSSSKAYVVSAALPRKGPKLFSSSPDPLTTTGSHNYFNGGMFNCAIGSKPDKKIVLHRPVPFRETKVKTVRKSVVKAVHIGRPVR